MKTIKVQVTQEDIDRGQQKAPASCPIKLALARARPLANGYAWVVGLRTVRAGSALRAAKIIDMPASVKSWVRSFDADRKSVAPFSFKIDSNGIHV